MADERVLEPELVTMLDTISGQIDYGHPPLTAEDVRHAGWVPNVPAHRQQSEQDQTLKLVLADWAEEHDYTSLGRLLRWLVERQKNPLWMYFTGSRKYGKPKPHSDYDWVIYLHDAAAELANLRALNPDSDSTNGQQVRFGLGGIDAALRFGPVNLLVVSTWNQWASWVEGTDLLENTARVIRADGIAVDREFAVRTFQMQFRARGLAPRQRVWGGGRFRFRGYH